MTQAAEPVANDRATHRVDALRRWYPPIRRREFWVVQALVLAIAGGHSLNEWSGLVDLHGAEFLPVSLYLLPVVYASLSFGMRGAAPTAVWSFALTLPNVLVWHEGGGALGEFWQASLVLAVGLFIGSRVDRERYARQQAEKRERERQASEDRYRGLFDIAADAILLLDGDGRILEANDAAQRLLGHLAETLTGTSVPKLNADLWRALHREVDASSEPIAIEAPSGSRWVQPVAVPFHDAEGRPRMLAQLSDVTLGEERKQMLESFARDTVAAREAERRRVARDLHDGPLQSLVLLWRSLDALSDPSGPDAGETLEEARARAEGVAEELRQFSRDLRPSLLDDLGLPPALNAEVAAFEERSGVKATFTAPGGNDHALPTEIALTLLRICQEALRNVERHAAARNVHVDLEVTDVMYRLVIRDDGTGIDSLTTPAKLIAAGRLGIVGMQERARLVGAMCLVQPAHPGTRVVVSGTNR